MAAEGLTDAQWAQFMEDGYLLLGATLSQADLALLNERLDDVMLGRVQYGDKLLMQLDPNAPMVTSTTEASLTAAPASAATAESQYAALNVAVSGQSVGFKGASMAYRKVGEAEAGLEVDDRFLAFMRRPIFRDICGRAYGHHAAVSVYRAMVMSKPANDLGGGTLLPWHQDGGDWWALDRDPLVFVWTALSPSTRENGAVQVVPGSHKLGLLSKRGHTLEPAALERVLAGGRVVDLELAPGESALVHNWTVHRSGTNATTQARRGFSANYVDARTRVSNPRPPLAGSLGTPGGSFPLVFDAPF